jgi:Mn-dependent DtxR family transcriptional regulator
MRTVSKNRSMKRIIRKAKNHREAHNWDIAQQVGMSPEERQKIASELKRRFYGSKNPDVREKKN